MKPPTWACLECPLDSCDFDGRVCGVVYMGTGRATVRHVPSYRKNDNPNPGEHTAEYYRERRKKPEVQVKTMEYVRRPGVRERNREACKRYRLNKKDRGTVKDGE